MILFLQVPSCDRVTHNIQIVNSKFTKLYLDPGKLFFEDVYQGVLKKEPPKGFFGFGQGFQEGLRAYLNPEY